MAVKSWNSKTNTLAFDDSIYDTNSNTWIRDYSYPQQQIPSAQESFEVFKTRHLSLSEDKNLALSLYLSNINHHLLRSNGLSWLLMKLMLFIDKKIN